MKLVTIPDSNSFKLFVVLVESMIYNQTTIADRQKLKSEHVHSGNLRVIFGNFPKPSVTLRASSDRWSSASSGNKLNP